MKCPKCGNEMKAYFPQDGYANAWRCLKCNWICENQESTNDKIRFMNLLDSLEVEYVTGVEEHVFYQNGIASLTVPLRKSDICVCDGYYDESKSHITPLNISYNLVIKFDDNGTFEGFAPYCTE